MTPLKFVAVVMLASVSLSVMASKNPKEDGNKQGIKFFHGTWAETLAKAKAEKKIIFMDAYTTWCGPCKMMQSRTFPDKKLGDYFNQKFISVKIDMEDGEGVSLAQMYGVEAYPTLFFIDPSGGKIVKRVLGFQPAEKLLSVGQSVAGK